MSPCTWKRGEYTITAGGGRWTVTNGAGQYCADFPKLHMADLWTERRIAEESFPTPDPWRTP